MSNSFTFGQSSSNTEKRLNYSSSRVGSSEEALSFNASLSNSIYGSSNTVQPASIVLINQIRY